jgi:hypothetical protein
MTPQTPEPAEPSGSSPTDRPAEPSLAYEPPGAHADGSLTGYQAGPPEPDAETPAERVPPRDAQQLWAVLGETTRRGNWRVPAHLMITTMLGETRLDLREAQLTAALTTIEVRGLLAEVRIIVPDRYRVECAGSVVLGEFEERDSAPTRPAPAGAPLIRVIGAVVLGQVRAYRTAAPVGEGRFAVDGMTGLRHRLRRRRGGSG